MTVNLNGIIFQQVYGDNSGGPEFDTDGDGRATQEDEFVSFMNNGTAPVDISGWQVWSDWTGSGAPDSGTDGRYHTFPPGTVLQPGEKLYVINEITGANPNWAQEASRGGAESGAGGNSTNFLSEGDAGSASESIVLVNPVTGQYIVFNMAQSASTVPSISGFPGTQNMGVVNGHAIQNDMNAGKSYQYNATTQSYQYGDVYVPCFARGTLIRTPSGDRPVEDLVIGDPVCTLDHGPQPLRRILVRDVDFADPAQAKDRPVRFAAGALGPGLPSRPLAVSPQHRMLVTLPDGRAILAPAKGLLHRPGVRIMQGLRRVQYVHLVLDRHEVVFANDAPAESYFGAHRLKSLRDPSRADIARRDGGLVRPALRVAEVARVI